ncbi:MAG: lamin tail domain-containing protein [Deltaproteobacteria bacterium]|nr:lamin tail domain-containing protein [Nannocystaceae bacterium]
MRLREPASALLLAAACGGSPIESSSQSAADTSSSGPLHGSSGEPVGDGSSDTTTAVPSSTSGDVPGESSSSTSSSDGGSLDDSSSSDGRARECHPILHEVLYDPNSGDTDDEFEWIELFNPCDDDIDLAGYELRSGGEGYGAATPLSGDIVAGGCLVIGGPTSDELNAEPELDVEIDFEPDFENADSAADSIALFVAGEEPPLASAVDRVVYGERNEFFPDARGQLGAPDVGDVDRGHSLARSDAAPGAGWVDSDQPSPNVCPNPPA